MADPAVKTANLLRRATTNAAKKGPSALDVWSHSVDGLKQQMRDYDPDAPPALARSVTDLGQAVVGRGWNNASPAGVAKGMDRQAAAIKKQLSQLNPFADPKPGEKPLEGVLQHVGAAFGVLTSIEQLVSMPLSLIPFPALPAVRILDFDVGLPHAHNHPPNLVPPAPPVPLPSTGPVIPIPVLSGASNVLINGMPAARCGDFGLGIWCGGYFPLYEIFLGSSSVWVDGARAARLAVDITKHCTFTTPRPSDPPMGPMVGFTVSASSDVVIGGVPMPSLTSLAMGKAFKALFKGLGKVAGKVRGMLGKGGSKTRFASATATQGQGMASNSVGKTDFVTLEKYRDASRLIKEMQDAKLLVIKGDDAFVKGTLSDLHLIACSNTGKKVLEEIRDSGKKVTIKNGWPPGSAPRSEHGARYNVDHPGGPRPGDGTPSVIHYKPGRASGPQSPSDSTLMHELGHARNAAKGEDMQHVKFGRPIDNLNWTDMEEFNNITKVDNPYRAERGLDQRTGHHDTP